VDLLVARNPDSGSSLPFLLRLPIGEGLVFRVKDAWPRANAVFCFPVGLDEWPAEPDLVESVPLRSCTRRGAAIDVVADRAREQRSQIVYTRARGRQMVFWQSPRTRKQAKPQVRVPTARGSGLAELVVLVDTRERYAYRFAGQQVTVVPRALPCGDYAVESGGLLVASVERKSMEDLVSSLTSGRLRFALTELASLPRAAVVVEDRYSRVLAQTWAKPSAVADGLAELQVRWPSIPIAFCDNRKLAEEWTYRYLAAAAAWAADEAVASELTTTDDTVAAAAIRATEPGTRELRAWARSHGLDVPDRGRLRPEILEAWKNAQTRP
jgi:hypothetical protein